MTRRRKKISAMLIAASHTAAHAKDTPQQKTANAPLPLFRATLAGVTGFALVLAISHVANADAVQQSSPSISHPPTIKVAACQAVAKITPDVVVNDDSVCERNA